MQKLAIDELLSTHGVKPTPQRVVIAEFLMDTHDHPTADDVFKAVSDKLPVPLSRATVYNTLSTLVNAGVIKQVFTEPDRTRYDANVTDHHHFMDMKTGKVIDIDPKQVANLKLDLGHNFKVHRYHVTFFGEVEPDQRSD